MIGMDKMMYPSVVSSLSPYPGAAVSQTVQGVLQVMPLTGSSGVRISGMLTGLEPNASGGWHVHSGDSCGADELVELGLAS